MKRFRMVILALAAALLLAGCSSNQKDALEQGIEALSEDRLDDAKVCFKGAVSQRSGQRYRRLNGEAYRYLGAISYLEEDLAEAERYFTAAAEYSDERDVLADVYAYLGEIYERTGREEEAVRAWSQSLDKKKDDVLSMKRMFLQWKTGQMTDGEAESELAAKFTRGDTLAGLYLAQIYVSAEDYEQAVRLYEEIYEKSQDAEVLLQIAACLQKSGDAEKLMEIYGEAENVLSGENLLLVLRNETAYYEGLREYEQALLKTEKYLSLDPDDEEMQKERIYLRTRLNLQEEETTQP